MDSTITIHRSAKGCLPYISGPPIRGFTFDQLGFSEEAKSKISSHEVLLRTYVHFYLASSVMVWVGREDLVSPMWMYLLGTSEAMVMSLNYPGEFPEPSGEWVSELCSRVVDKFIDYRIRGGYLALMGTYPMPVEEGNRPRMNFLEPLSSIAYHGKSLSAGWKRGDPNESDILAYCLRVLKTDSPTVCGLTFIGRASLAAAAVSGSIQSLRMYGSSSPAHQGTSESPEYSSRVFAYCRDTVMSLLVSKCLPMVELAGAMYNILLPRPDGNEPSLEEVWRAGARASARVKEHK